MLQKGLHTFKDSTLENSPNALKTPKKGVNIFHKLIYCITVSLSTLCKTYCFAIQKRRFCKVKAAVLPSKTAAFAMPNRNCRFSPE